MTEAHITNRERQVLFYIKQGKANKEIANDLHLSVRTVKFHITNLLAKTECRSRLALACNFFLVSKEPCHAQ